MKIGISGALLDACVLGALSVISTYGYDLTQKIQVTINVSESTLYPVLRRLLKENLLEAYDEPFDGRNRRYYKITPQGKATLNDYILEWENYKKNIDFLLNGGKGIEQN